VTRVDRVGIAITGIGVVAPTGVTEAAFRASLLAARSAIAPGADGLLRAPSPDFEAKRFLPASQMRRMPRLVQMTIVAAKQALADAARIELPAGPLPDAMKAPADALGLDPTRVGAIIGTGLGTFDQTMEFLLGYLEGGPEAASPLLFPTSVMNAAAGLLSVECGLRGVNSTVNHKDSSPLLAIGMAMDQLYIRRADAIVVGAADELCDPILEGYRLLGGMCSTVMRPYDRARTGLGLGESAALVVLERLDDAVARRRRIHAIIRHRAETSEDRPRVGWGEGVAGAEAVRVVTEAIAPFPEIDWIAGGGNGTKLDELELSALRRGFGDRPLPPISSILSQTGESAASGSLRIAAAIAAIQEGYLPGTLNLGAPLDGYGDVLLREARRQPVRRVLVPSFGQGGSNSALVIERA
jgi:3-oxoacyl-[acyl-carrier-protein] synthase II